MPDQIQAAIDGYAASLPEGTTERFRIDAADYLGVPVSNVDLFTPDGYYNGVGYGATPREALLGAYGELAEECHAHLSYRKLPVREGTYRELVAELGAGGVLDPLSLVLPAGSPYHPDLPLRWVPIQRYGDGAEVLCPAEFVAIGDEDLPDYPNQLTTAIRNGSGAGDTESRAVLHGILELLQRDGNADCFRALDRGRVIDPATVDGSVRQVLDELAGRGLHVTMKLARTTCGCASVYAVGDDRTEDTFALGATGCGEAADPDVQRALRKAVLECASSHSRKRFNNLPFDRVADTAPAGYFERIRGNITLAQEEQRALRAMVDFVTSDKAEVRNRLADSVFLQRTVVSAADLPHLEDESIEARLGYVLEQLALEGMEPYLLRMPTAGEHCSVVRVIVPDMEMEFGSYHRIGRRGVARLLREDPHQLLQRAAGPGRKRIRLTNLWEERLGGPFYLDTARLDAIIDPLYGLYREPIAHAAPIAIEEDYFADLSPAS